MQLTAFHIAATCYGVISAPDDFDVFRALTREPDRNR